MRIVKMISGICVLFTSVAFARILQGNLRQHLEFLQRLDAMHASHEAAHNPAFVAGFVTGIIIAVFSVVGGGLLLARK